MPKTTRVGSRTGILIQVKSSEPEQSNSAFVEDRAMIRLRLVIAISLAVALAACATPLTTREKGALAGGAIGAGAGAAIGSTTGHTGTGALIGAGVGAVGGALIGDALQANEQRQATQAPPPPAPLAPVVVAPPPPVVVSSPRLIWVPQWGVYVLEGQDIVYHDSLYYYQYEGRWYVTRAYTGPWAVVGSRPAVLAQIPPGQFHKRLPPGLEKKGMIPPGHMR
jgi:hypothetical protein